MYHFEREREWEREINLIRVCFCTQKINSTVYKITCTFFFTVVLYMCRLLSDSVWKLFTNDRITCMEQFVQFLVNDHVTCNIFQTCTVLANILSSDMDYIFSFLHIPTVWLFWSFSNFKILNQTLKSFETQINCST